MYSDTFLHMCKMLQKNFFSFKVRMVLAKMNLYLNLPVYSLICMQKIKNENKINNNYHMPHAHISLPLENEDEQQFN